MNLKNKISFLVLSLVSLLLLSNCRIIRQGEVGVKRTLGKIKPVPLEAGPKLYNPFTTVILKVPTRTVNLEVDLSLPSKEGVNVAAGISILYSVEGRKSTKIIEDIGPGYERAIILPVFRASAADITAKFMAKDMHTGKRLEIEERIRQQMAKILEPRGFNIEAVLLKSIVLPRGLARAIEEKMEAEQEAERMQFVLQRESQEAQRRKIEAEGIRDANTIISEGLTPQVIQYKSIEAFRELSRSNNAKVIMTDGKTPLLINQD